MFGPHVPYTLCACLFPHCIPALLDHRDEAAGSGERASDRRVTLFRDPLHSRAEEYPWSDFIRSICRPARWCYGASAGVCAGHPAYRAVGARTSAPLARAWGADDFRDPGASSDQAAGGEEDVCRGDDLWAGYDLALHYRAPSGFRWASSRVLGAADVVSVVVRSSLVQLETPDEMRGRVSAVNSLFIGTSNQLGEFESGVTASWFGIVPATILRRRRQRPHRAHLDGHLPGTAKARDADKRAEGLTRSNGIRQSSIMQHERSDGKRGAMQTLKGRIGVEGRSWGARLRSDGPFCRDPPWSDPGGGWGVPPGFEACAVSAAGYA